MSAKNENDISNVELLAAINAGFTNMQKQMDQRFEAVDRRFDEVDHRFDENSEEHAVINQKLDSCINRLDDHDRRITKLEAKIA